MPKTFDSPQIEQIRNIGDVKKALRELVDTLTFQYERLAETTITTSQGFTAYIGNPLTNGSWRFNISGSGVSAKLLVQVRVSGTWTTKWEFTQS